MYKKVVYIDSYAADFIMRKIRAGLTRGKICCGYKEENGAFAVVCSDFFDYIELLPVLDYCSTRYAF